MPYATGICFNDQYNYDPQKPKKVRGSRPKRTEFSRDRECGHTTDSFKGYYPYGNPPQSTSASPETLAQSSCSFTPPNYSVSLPLDSPPPTNFRPRGAVYPQSDPYSKPLRHFLQAHGNYISAHQPHGSVGNSPTSSSSNSTSSSSASRSPSPQSVATTPPSSRHSSPPSRHGTPPSRHGSPPRPTVCSSPYPVVMSDYDTFLGSYHATIDHTLHRRH